MKYLIFIIISAFVIFSLGIYNQNKIDKSMQNTYFYTHKNQDENHLNFEEIKIKTNEKMAHASSMIKLDDRLVILFFAGTREGARDVKIYKATILEGKEQGATNLEGGERGSGHIESKIESKIESVANSKNQTRANTISKKIIFDYNHL